MYTKTMARHPVRKFTALFVIYGIIIFGIFVLQFRNESSVSKTFGSLQLRLTLADVPKNSFYVSAHGLTLYADEANPLVLESSDKHKTPLMLQSWQETSNTSFELFFSENVVLSFDGSGDQFTLNTTVPLKKQILNIPYKTTKNHSVTEIGQQRALIKSKLHTYILQAEALSYDYIHTNKASAFVHFTPYTEVFTFSFASIASFNGAQPETLNLLRSQARTKLVEKFADSSADKLNEQSVAAYIAESALTGNYRGALENTPAAFKDSSKRTYFTAPYFNSLAKMNQTLVMEQENIAYRIQYSLDKKTPDVFELDRFCSIVRQNSPEKTAEILALPASLPDFKPTLAQAAGILSVYARLHSQMPASAAYLDLVLSMCVDSLESACSLSDNETLSLSENGQPADAVLTAKAGKALYDYGIIASKHDIRSGGIMLLFSALQNIDSADVRTLAELYPYIADDNKFYPHTEVIGFEKGNPVWAWTVSPEIKYAKDQNGTVTVEASFIPEETHYMILNGIEPFSSIEIYEMPYRTDPRFEIYNSSGYIYNAESKTLFLKFKHKKEVEAVKLYYRNQRQPTYTTGNVGSVPPASEAKEASGGFSETEKPAQKQSTPPTAPPPAAANTAPIQEQKRDQSAALETEQQENAAEEP